MIYIYIYIYRERERVVYHSLVQGSIVYYMMASHPWETRELAKLLRSLMAMLKYTTDNTQPTKYETYCIHVADCYHWTQPPPSAPVLQRRSCVSLLMCSSCTGHQSTDPIGSVCHGHVFISDCAVNKMSEFRARKMNLSSIVLLCIEHLKGTPSHLPFAQALGLKFGKSE